jgi:hypothetical protein
MQYFAAVVNALMLIKSAWTSISAWVKKRREQKHDDAVQTVKQAKTKEELEKALDESANNP